jgi:hypothetical protein
MSDIDVTIGAKNDASRIINEFSRDVASAAHKVEFSFKGMTQMVGAGVLAAGFVKLTQAAVDFSVSSLAAFDKTNNAAIQLQETLEVISGNAGAGAGLRQLASELEKATNIDEGSILTQMATATRKGGTPEDIEEMTKAAIGLARVYNTDLSTAMRKVQAAVDGELGDFKSLAEVSRVAQEGLKNQAAAANTAAEAGARMDVSWKNLLETVGRIMSPIREITVEVMDGLVTAIDLLIPKVEDLVAAFDWMKDRARDAFRAMADSVVTAMAACTTLIQDFSRLVEIAGTSIELSLERIRASFEYVFSQAIPSYMNLVGGLFDPNGNASLENIAKMFLSGNIGKAGEALANVAPSMQKSGAETALETRLDSLVKPVVESFMDRLGINKDAFDKMFDALFEGSNRPFNPKVNLRDRSGASGGGGADRILSSFQSDTLRFSPNAPDRDKMERIALDQLELQRQMKQELADWNAFIRGAKKGEFVFIP